MTNTERPQPTRLPRKTSGGPRSRFRSAPACGVVLGPRDEALLSALFLCRTMTRGQLQTLFFSSVPRCNARLRQLFDWDYLARAFLPTAPFGSQALYSVGKAAVPLVRDCMGRAGFRLEDEDLRAQCRRPALSLLEHTLAVGDIYIAVQKALAAQPSVQLEHWLPERLCCHEYEVRRIEEAGFAGTRRWRKEVFRPDAFLRLTCRDSPNARNDNARNFFLEVDRGHTSRRQFGGKLRTHARFLDSGLFAEVYGWERFQTLVITTGPKRRDNLQALAEQQKSNLFWFTTRDEVEQSGILASIWRMPFQVNARALL